MPRALIIADYDLRGGTWTFLTKLLKFHQKNGIDTAILIPESLAMPAALALFEDLKVKVYVGPQRGRLWGKPYAALLYDVVFACKPYRDFRPDLIVVSTGSFDLLQGNLIWPRPVIIGMHTYPPAAIKNFKRLGSRLLVRLMCLSDKKCFLTFSHASARMIHAYLGVPTSNLRVIYNSYQATRSRADVSKQKIVLTAGHVVWYKNPNAWLDVIQRVLQRHPDTRFVWLGEGEMLETMRHRVRALQLEQNVSLPGYTTQIDERYAEALIYFQPSLIENHSIAVVEAMAHGLPCVTSNAGGLPESVIDGETGFMCPPDDVEGFSTRLIELLDKPNLREEMGQAGQRRAQTLFSEVTQERELIGLYNTLLRVD